MIFLLEQMLYQRVHPSMSLPSCIICYDALDGSEDISALHCGHVFHYRCIDGWGKSCLRQGRKKSSCPSCKRKVDWFPAQGTVFKLYLEFDASAANRRVKDLEAELEREKKRYLKGEEY